MDASFCHMAKFDTHRCPIPSLLEVVIQEEAESTHNNSYTYSS